MTDRCELLVDDDGDVNVDFLTEEKDFVTLCFGEEGGLDYAVLLSDGRKAHGRVLVHREIFEALRKLVPNAQLEPRAEAAKPL